MSKSKIASAIQPPFKAQSYYEKELLKFVDSIEDELFKKYSIADSDAVDAILAFILSYMDNVPLFSTIALNFVNLINTVNEDKYKKGLESIGIKEVINADVSKLLDSARADNVARIVTIPKKLHDQLEPLLKEAYGNGGNIEKTIRKRFDVTRSRAKIIARDQTATINANLYQIRSEANGSEEYIWRTSEDERVRETAGHNHKKLNGKKFTWKEGSPCCGHPGHDILCRCLARAIYLV